MSNKIKVDQLSDALKQYLQEYAEDIQEDVEEATDKVTKEAKEELILTSPRGKSERTNKYYQGWAIKTVKNKKNQYHKVLWNKTNYQLTHLLEFGHATRNGGRTKAIPHIRPVEKKYSAKFTELLEEKIKRSSR